MAAVVAGPKLGRVSQVGHVERPGLDSRGTIVCGINPDGIATSLQKMTARAYNLSLQVSPSS